MRPTIKRTATGAIVLYLDAPAVTVTLTRDDAVMLAHEVAGCVPGLVVTVLWEPKDIAQCAPPI